MVLHFSSPGIKRSPACVMSHRTPLSILKPFLNLVQTSRQERDYAFLPPVLSGPNGLNVMMTAGVTAKSQINAMTKAITELQAKVKGPANLLFIKLKRHTPEIMVVKMSTRPTLRDVRLKAVA